MLLIGHTLLSRNHDANQSKVGMVLSRRSCRTACTGHDKAPLSATGRLGLMHEEGSSRRAKLLIEIELLNATSGPHSHESRSYQSAEPVGGLPAKGEQHGVRIVRNSMNSIRVPSGSFKSSCSFPSTPSTCGFFPAGAFQPRSSN